MSILGVTVLCYEFANIYTNIYVERDYGYILQNIFYTTEEMYEFDYVTLGRMNNSANFIFGLTGGDLWNGNVDIQNNPYVDVKGLAMTNGALIELHDRYEFEICSQDHVAKFMPPWAFTWYAQPLCFKDRDNVQLFNSWWYETFSNPTIGYFYCKNTTENNNWCKSEDQIDDWLA